MAPSISDADLLIAVANTAHAEQDELAGAASVRDWWRGLGEPTARETAVENAATLRALRTLIRGLALRNNGIEPDLTEASGLDGLVLHLDLLGAPSLRADVPGDLGRDIGAATVAALLRAMARPDWSRMKACRGEDCRWVFVDGSRNASRRWCAMANCGNRAKVATFRDRQRQTLRTRDVR